MEITTVPNKYTSIELFAGAGGLALGLEQAGFHHVLLNEYDKTACKTLRINRPYWNVIEKDIHSVDFTEYKWKIDLLSGAHAGCASQVTRTLCVQFENLH